MPCSIAKEAGSGRARMKYRGKQKTLSNVSLYFFSALLLPTCFTTELV